MILSLLVSVVTPLSLLYSYDLFSGLDESEEGLKHDRATIESNESMRVRKQSESKATVVGQRPKNDRISFCAGSYATREIPPFWRCYKDSNIQRLNLNVVLLLIRDTLPTCPNEGALLRA